MIHTQALRLANRLARRKLIDHDRVEWCAYVLERRCTTALSLLVLTLWGSLWANWSYGVCFLFFTMFLRKRTSGLHAKSYAGCLAGSMLLVAPVCAAIARLPGAALPGLTGAAACACGCICLFAPYDHPDLHLAPAEHAALKKASCCRACLVLALALLFWRCGAVPYSLACCFGLLAAASLLCLPLCLEKKENIMKDHDNMLEKAFSRLLNAAIEREAKAWPPTCESILYQPRRPEQPLSPRAPKEPCHADPDLR